VNSQKTDVSTTTRIKERKKGMGREKEYFVGHIKKGSDLGTVIKLAANNGLQARGQGHPRKPSPVTGGGSKPDGEKEGLKATSTHTKREEEKKKKKNQKEKQKHNKRQKNQREIRKERKVQHRAHAPAYAPCN